MPLVLACIPARFQSTRFPGKVLAPLGDATMLEHVWRRVGTARHLDRVVIATDDDRVSGVARDFGAEVRMTSTEHPTGTDRIGEVVAQLAQEDVVPDVIVNVQADEPFVTGSSLDALVEAITDDDAADVATLVEPLEDVDTLFDPNVVKVAVALNGQALYFSRSPIPYRRGGTVLSADFRDVVRDEGPGGYYCHQGIYAFARTAFQRFVAWEPTPLERSEGLEQLRALEHGLTFRAVVSDFRAVGVDTPEDLERARHLMLEAG